MKRLLQLVVVMMMVFGVVSQAFPITIGASLVGGGSRTAIESGSFSLLSSFTASEIGLMSDSSNSTGFTRTSNLGENTPNLTGGVQKRFDFDISQFSTIDEITFGWTGGISGIRQLH